MENQSTPPINKRLVKSQAECLDSLHEQSQKLQNQAENYPMLPIVFWVFIIAILFIGLDVLLHN